ncbi:hypothetical protein EI752_27435, partial [Salmonella enterica]|nr:hypothetical protein [Salmonella enterica]
GLAAGHAVDNIIERYWTDWQALHPRRSGAGRGDLSDILHHAGCALFAGWYLVNGLGQMATKVA